MSDNNIGNNKYFILDYTHEELCNILDMIADFDGGITEARVIELIKEAQLGKEAKYFNELEKYQTLDEFKKMYYKANELLNKGI